MRERKTGRDDWEVHNINKDDLHRVIDVHTMMIIRLYNGFTTIHVLDRCFLFPCHPFYCLYELSLRIQHQIEREFKGNQNSLSCKSTNLEEICMLWGNHCMLMSHGWSLKRKKKVVEGFAKHMLSICQYTKTNITFNFKLQIECWTFIWCSGCPRVPNLTKKMQ